MAPLLALHRDVCAHLLHILNRITVGVWASCLVGWTRCALLLELYLPHNTYCRLFPMQFKGLLFTWVTGHAPQAHRQKILALSGLCWHIGNTISSNPVHQQKVRAKLDQSALPSEDLQCSVDRQLIHKGVSAKSELPYILLAFSTGLAFDPWLSFFGDSLLCYWLLYLWNQLLWP